MACTSSRCCVVARRKRRAWLPVTNGWGGKGRTREWGGGWGEARGGAWHAPSPDVACGPGVDRVRCMDRDRCQGRLGYISSAVAITRHHPQSNPGDFMAYETIAVRVEADQVGVITLDRPKQLNALNDLLMNELGAALKAWD